MREDRRALERNRHEDRGKNQKIMCRLSAEDALRVIIVSQRTPIDQRGRI